MKRTHGNRGAVGNSKYSSKRDVINDFFFLVFGALYYPKGKGPKFLTLNITDV